MGQDYLTAIKQYNVRSATPRLKHTALLVIDMQEYFSEIALPALKNVRTILEAARNKRISIIFTRHGHQNPTRDGGMLKDWWGNLIKHGSCDWHLMKGLRNRENELIIDKNRYSAFFGTELEDILRQQEISDLIITGVMTNCCCETTARDAFNRDFRVFFAADATATADEELHISSLKNLAYGFSHIVSTEQICDWLK